MPQKTVVIIGGPTASGKTSAATSLAQELGTEIISADSRQCFKELNIGVARPSPKELSLVPHHFIASHSIHENVTAATFEAYALQRVNALFQHRDVVVMAGGTGLYLQAFCQGFDAIPEIPGTIRKAIQSEYAQNGLQWLQAEVARLDEAWYASGETQNPQRLMRALEVYRATGQSILHFQKKEKKERPFRIIKTVLELPKEQLHQNINNRVDAMLAQGLLAEVESLFPFRHLNALQTVGYKELFDYLSGDSLFDDAVLTIKQNTRQYAKRQRTWFRKNEAFVPLPALDVAAIIDDVRQLLKSDG